MYTQRDEEPHILKYLGQEPGRLLDVGAFDGRTFSTTLALIERGWGGVLFEPSLLPFQALQQLHVDNPNVRTIRAAVTNDIDGDIEMFVTADALSTTEPAHVRKWEAVGVPFEPLRVPAVSVRTVVGFGPFDFVSVDTEATSVPLAAKLLDALAETSRLPRLVCVEHDSAFVAIERLARRHQLRLIHKTAENVLLGRL